ncbi:Alkaline-phosphatase-like, core domain containing protein [Elaphomyces granulatus]
MKSSSILWRGYLAWVAVSNACAVERQEIMRPSLRPSLSDCPLSGRPPNIVFILTDDQDLQLDSLSYMPSTIKHLQKKGTFYRNHFVTTALCCPSRVSLWTGRYAHNTNVTDVSPPYGGYPKFVQQGFNENFLPVWLQQAGYNTYYTGKLFNALTVDNYNAPYVAGFNGSDFLLDPYTYSYLNSTYQRNHDPPISYEGRYTADVLEEKAFWFLDEATTEKRPFFLAIAPISPHSNIDPSGTGLTMTNMTAPIPADRHRDLFKGVKVPRTHNFNPDQPSGVNWISRLPQQNQSNIDYNDYFYRSRLRALQTVDELVDGVITRLAKSGHLDNTFIIYTSDNGYHIGQHRLQPGKTCGFEEDIRVPLFIRGPGIPVGSVEDGVSSHVDLVPTIFQIAGIPPRADFDGTPLAVGPHPHRVRTEHVNVEFWGLGLAEGRYDSLGPDNPSVITNNTYKALRLIGEDYNLYYSVWCGGEHQLYDLHTDPYELHNLYCDGILDSNDDRTLFGYPISQVVLRLDALLLVLKSCQGVTCVQPWRVLHPAGDVHDLPDALHTQYDQFYREQVKVAYSRCESGYLVNAEGPQEPQIYRDLTSRDGISWHHWV